MKKRGKVFLSLAMVFAMVFVSLPIFSMATNKSENSIVEDLTKESINPSTQESKQHTVTIKAKNVIVNLNDDSFDLLDNVSAMDENNKKVEVEVEDDGGFDISVAKQYTIIYQAKHPEEQKSYTATRKVTVKEQKAIQTFELKAPKAVVPITTEAELIQALSEANENDVIELSNDIILYSKVIITKKNITLDGKGHKLSLNTGYSDRHIELDAIATLKNLVLEGHGDSLGGGLTTQFEATLENVSFNNINSIGSSDFLSPLQAVRKLTVKGGTFSNNKGAEGGAIKTYGPYDIEGTVFSNNSATGRGGALHLNPENGTVKNSTFNDNKADEMGGAIFSYGKLAIENSTFDRNSAQTYGGAITIYDGHVSFSNNTVINNNNAKIGGGGVWHVGNSAGVINVNDSKITNNQTTDVKFTKGGGIGAEGKVDIVLNNATIKANSAVDGGGIYNIAASTTMTGGEISENKALYEGPTGVRSSLGGGIYGKDIVINSGSINNNKIENKQPIGGGGIATSDNGSISMSSGEIKDNGFAESSHGGGILAGKNNKVEIFGNAVISGHISSGNYTYGGGINGQEGTIINIRGNAVIKENNAFIGGGVRVENNGEINIKENAQIIKNTAYHASGVTAEVVSSSSGIVKKANVNISGGYVGENIGRAGSHSHVGGVSGYEVNISGGKVSNNYIPLGDASAVSAAKFNMSGGEVSNNRIGKSFSNSLRARGAAGADSVRISGGSISNNIIDDLSGTPTYGGGLSVILEEKTPVLANPTVHITGGTIKGNTANYGGGMSVWGDLYDGSQNHKIIVENATLDNNSATNYGGGIAFLGVDAHSRGNSRDNHLILKNANIVNNTANYGGGVYSRSDFSEITGGTIKGNSAKKLDSKGGFGGGIIANGKFNIKDGTLIDNNTAEGSGGGIYSYTTYIDPKVGERMYMPNALTLENGVKVINNKANGAGGGIVASDSAVYENTELNIKNGVIIENNESKSYAGGIMHNRVNTVIQDGVVINKNQAPEAGGISTNRSKLTITDQGRLNKITNNIANDPDENIGDGGGIWTGDLNHLNIKNTLFENNKAASGYFIKDNSDIEKCNNTVNVTKVSEPFELAYNNFDIFYKKGTKLEYFNVNYDTDGGSEVKSTKAMVNSLVTEPTEPTKSGFDFNGWYKDQARTQRWDFNNDRVNSDITIYAGWKQKPVITYYDVNFDTRGGSPINSIKVEQNGLINRPADPTLDGFRFLGWNTSPIFDGEWNFSTNRVTGNLTLYARWEYIPVDPAPTEPVPTTPENPTPTPNPPARNVEIPTPEVAQDDLEINPLDGITPRSAANPDAASIEPENPQDTINEGDVPLGTRPFFDHACWIHWLMLLGIILTIVYTVVHLTKKTRKQGGHSS